MMNLEGEEVHQSNAGWSPVYVQDNLGVMSIGFMLPNPDDAIVWRGPRKNALIKQYKYQFALSGVEFHITQEALCEVAKTALSKSTGARGLRNILEGQNLRVLRRGGSREDHGAQSRRH